ncbi:MAG: UbiA family prenyltransferase [Candidatus Zixiibacteriota bacterium]
MVVKILDFIFMSRPMLLIPVWTVYLHYLSDCTVSGYGNASINLQFIWQLIVLGLVFAGTYIINQIFDIESDRANNKLFFLPGGIISIEAAWIYYGLLTAAGLGFAYFISRHTFYVALYIVILGIMYSAPRIRLKDNLFGGLLANAVAYGFLIPFMIGLFCAGRLPALSSIPYFLAIATGYILTTLPDYEGDVISNKLTVAVVLGERGALILALLSALATGVISYLISNYEMTIVAGITSLLVAILLFRQNKSLLLFTCKFPILLLTLLAGAHYPFYLAFLLLTITLTRFYYKKRFDIIYPKLS